MGVDCGGIHCALLCTYYVYQRTSAASAIRINLDIEQPVMFDSKQGVKMGSRESRMLINRFGAQILWITKVVHPLRCTCGEPQLLKWLMVYYIATPPSSDMAWVCVFFNLSRAPAMECRQHSKRVVECSATQVYGSEIRSMIA